MPTMLDDMIVLLPGKFPWLVFGDTFFASNQPNSPDFCVTIYQYSGNPPSFLFGGVAWENPQLQVRVRSKFYDEAQERSAEIWDFLNTQFNVIINGFNYLEVSSESSPGQVSGPDPDNRIDLVTNFFTSREK